MDVLMKLKDDQVINVKLVLAELVKNHMDEKGKLSDNGKFVELYEFLKEDKDEEIRYLF
jgi:hypothetical protein